MGIGPSGEKEAPKHQHPQHPPAKTPQKIDASKPKTKPVSIKRDSNSFNDDDDITLIVSPPSKGDGPRSEYSEKNHEVTTVFNWKHGGKEVYLTGTFNGWAEKIPMRESQGDFTVIQNLPPGVHYYRYIVDGKWQTDPSLPSVVDGNGERSNLLEVIEPRKEESILAQQVSSSPPGSYSQHIPEPLESAPTLATLSGSTGGPPTNQEPPMLPPHLLRALLNTQPPSQADPSLLPLPHHVMLNHLYSLTRKDEKTMILGITQRYRHKFVTSVLYKPLDPNALPSNFKNQPSSKTASPSSSPKNTTADLSPKQMITPTQVSPEEIVFSNFENGGNEFMEMGE